MNTLTIEVPQGDTCEKCKFIGYYSYSSNGTGYCCKLFDTDIRDKEKCLACRLLSRNKQNQSEEFGEVVVKAKKKEPYVLVKDLNELLMSKYEEYQMQCILKESNNEYTAEAGRWQAVREIIDEVDKLKRV